MSTISRRDARRAAVFMLFQWDVTGRPLGSLYEGEVDDYTRQLTDAVHDSVRHHLVADVPVAVFLSAGLDSGALLGTMAQLGVRDPAAITLSPDPPARRRESAAPTPRARLKAPFRAPGLCSRRA